MISTKRHKALIRIKTTKILVDNQWDGRPKTITAKLHELPDYGMAGPVNT